MHRSSIRPSDITYKQTFESEKKSDKKRFNIKYDPKRPRPELKHYEEKLSKH